MKRKVVIFGAAGYVGSILRRDLADRGCEVVPVVKNVAQQGAVPSGSLVANVLDVHQLEGLVRRIGFCHSIIYSVGHCPSGGFDDENRVPLLRIDDRDIEAHFQRLVFGLHNVVRVVSKTLIHGASIIVIGSAITRLTDEMCPPWLHAGDYASAQAAQAEYVCWLRRDPDMRGECLSIHRLAIGPIEGSPFFDGTTHQPPAFVPTKELVSQVVRLIGAARSEDLELLPQSPNSQLSLIQP